MKMKTTINSRRFRANQTIISVLLLLFSFSISGCAALFVAGAGAGAYTYVSGNLVREYQADYDDLVDAGHQVFEKLNIELIEEQGTGLNASMEGNKEDTTSVTITINRLGKLRSEVGVRTGVVGYASLEQSEEIHKAIVAELKTMKKYASINFVGSEDLADQEEQIVTLHAIRVEKSYSDHQNSAGSQQSQKSSGKTQVAEGLSYLKGSSETIYLYFNRTERTVPKRMHQALKNVAETMKQNQRISLHVQGYTDAVGSNDDNIALSSLWAEQVRWYLVDRGIAPDRIRANGYGAANFFESNNSSGLQAMNRRVELHFIP